MNRTVITTALNELGTPKVIETDSFETLLNENITLAKEILGEEWYPLESDPYMKKLRVLTLRQIHNQADKNSTILSLLATTATGNDLDSIGIDRGVIRNKGQAPYADFKFNLTKVSDGTLLIPKGTRVGILWDSENYASVIKDYFVENNNSSIVVQAELSYPCVSSEIIFDTLITDIPYIRNIEQLSSFGNGSDVEDDERYRIRIILNRNRFNTAGSIDAYTFFTFSADNRIDDVYITSEKSLEVNVYISSENGVDEMMLERVSTALNKRDVRPLSDKVIVKRAKEIHVNISAIIEVFKIEEVSNIKKEIEANFKSFFYIGQNLVKSDLIRKLHVEGVYKVSTSFQDVLAKDNEVIKITSIDLNFKKAVL